MSDIDAIRSLLPQSKFDTEKAEALAALGYPAVAPILPELFLWLQDYNWPVAHVLAPFLSSIGLPLLPHVRDILVTDDDLWKYWVLSCAVEPSPPLAQALRKELLRLADAPTPNEVAEELDMKARGILESLGEGTEVV